MIVHNYIKLDIICGLTKFMIWLKTRRNQMLNTRMDHLEIKLNHHLGKDFNFNYQPFAEVATDPSLATGITSELQVNTQSQVSLFNKEFVVGAGGGVNSVSSGTYFTGDFVVEYVVSDDGRLKLKAYNRSDPDINGNRNKTGVGVSYSLEFNTFKREKPEPVQIIEETGEQ